MTRSGLYSAAAIAALVQALPLEAADPVITATRECTKNQKVKVNASVTDTDKDLETFIVERYRYKTAAKCKADGTLHLCAPTGEEKMDTLIDRAYLGEKETDTFEDESDCVKDEWYLFRILATDRVVGAKEECTKCCQCTLVKFCCLPTNQCLEGDDSTSGECEVMGGTFGTGQGCAELECGQQIPATSEWGMIVLALLVMAAGTTVIRRARSPTPFPPDP